MRGTAFPDEVRPLAGEVDHLLDAQEAAIARARTRAADLAHGLKTPLTILASNAEELRARGETSIAEEIATVTDGMRRHVERELVRARAGIRARAGAPQPLRPVVEQVIGVLRRTPRGHPLSWEIAIGDDLALAVDARTSRRFSVTSARMRPNGPPRGSEPKADVSETSLPSPSRTMDPAFPTTRSEPSSPEADGSTRPTREPDWVSLSLAS